MPSPTLDSFSNTATDKPFWLANLAIDNPITPAPIITISKIIKLP
jgi:hypothetical protein